MGGGASVIWGAGLVLYVRWVVLVLYMRWAGLVLSVVGGASIIQLVISIIQYKPYQWWSGVPGHCWHPSLQSRQLHHQKWQHYLHHQLSLQIPRYPGLGSQGWTPSIDLVNGGQERGGGLPLLHRLLRQVTHAYCNPLLDNSYIYLIYKIYLIIIIEIFKINIL